ncbi:MAG TPA: hypothetical protein VHM90_04595 [Phycisphaerae bacterium]|nr:hypothetical protein [Phycisphaerae bacterium]
MKAFLDLVHQLGGDIFQLIAALVLRHDVAIPAITIRFLKGAKHVFSRGAGGKDGFAIGLGKLDIVDEREMQEVIRLLHQLGIDCWLCFLGKRGAAWDGNAQHPRHGDGGRKNHTRPDRPLTHNAS